MKDRLMAIVCGVLYDLLKKAPLLAISKQGISLVTRRGATIVEGAIYGGLVIVIGNCFLALLSVEEEMKKEKGEEEKETPEEFISYNVSIIVICILVLTVFFNFKTPWYLRRLFSIFFN